MNSKKSNYEPKLYKDIVKRKLSSLETLLSKGNFEEFLQEADKISPSELKQLKENRNDLPNDLDNMLFNFPKYAFKTEVKKDEETENTLILNVLDSPTKKEKISIMREGALEVAQRLLELGANPNTPFDSFVTPFMKFCEINSLELVKTLADNTICPVKIEAMDSGGNKALSFATLADQPDIIEYLVTEKNCNVNFKSILSLGQTAFHQACLHAKVGSAQKLMDLNADPTISDVNGLLPGNLIPEYDEEEDDIEAIDPKDLEKWETLYQDVLSYYQTYKEKNKPKKLTF